MELLQLVHAFSILFLIHRAIGFIDVHPHSTAAGLICDDTIRRILRCSDINAAGLICDDTIRRILRRSDTICSVADGVCIISGSGDARITDFSIDFADFHHLLVITARDIASCVGAFVFPLPQTHRHRDNNSHSSSSSSSSSC